jgi:hypothetical protein
MAARVTLELLDLETVVACLKCGMIVSRPAADSASCTQCGANVVGHTTLELAQLESLAGSLKALCDRPEGGAYRIRLQIAAAEPG